ncbi:MAG: RDD family protein, partial [Candidatus Heimdallarchaeota archaeon]
MSEERIKYETSPLGPRLIALIIDFVIPIPLITIFFQWGISIEWELFWKNLVFVGVEFSEVELILLILMFLLSILVYFIVVPSFTDGQTVGKIVMGLHVVYDDNSSTKKDKFLK